MLTKKIVAVAGIGLFMGVASIVQAATIVWQTPVSVSTVGDSIISTNGVPLEAINWGSGTYTVNGVTFVENTIGLSNAYSNFSDLDRPYVYSSLMYTDGGISTAFESIMDSFGLELYGTGMDNSEKLVAYLGNLIVGESYEVQFLVSDDRNASTQGWTLNFTGGAGVSGEIPNGDSYSLTGNFIADAATQSIIVDRISGQTEVAINGYQLRVVPLPAGFLLFGSGLILLGLWRKWSTPKTNKLDSAILNPC